MNNLDDAILDLLQAAVLDRNNEENWSTLTSLLYEHERFDQLIECEKILRAEVKQCYTYDIETSPLKKHITSFPGTLDLSGLDELEVLCNNLRLAGKLDEAVRCYTFADVSRK